MQTTEQRTSGTNTLSTLKIDRDNIVSWRLGHLDATGNMFSTCTQKFLSATLIAYMYVIRWIFSNCVILFGNWSFYCDVWVLNCSLMLYLSLIVRIRTKSHKLMQTQMKCETDATKYHSTSFSTTATTTPSQIEFGLAFFFFLLMPHTRNFSS